MASKKYPLDPLLKLREDEASRATRALADAVRERETAERRKRAAEEEKVRAAERERATREAEAEKLARGELKVADLMRADAWGVAVAAEREELQQRVDRADEGVRTAKAGEGQARANVAARKADADVVEKDREKWRDRARRDAEAREEQEAAEVWRPKRG